VSRDRILDVVVLVADCLIVAGGLLLTGALAARLS
jgi:hypothetical protein